MTSRPERKLILWVWLSGWFSAMRYLGPSLRYNVMVVIARLAASAGFRYSAISAHSFRERLAMSPSPGGRCSLVSFPAALGSLTSSVPSEWMISV